MENLWLSLTMMLFAGFGMIINIAAVNTLLQAINEDDKRGRVMSFYIMAFIGMTPFGNLLAGALADISLFLRYDYRSHNTTYQYRLSLPVTLKIFNSSLIRL